MGGLVPYLVTMQPDRLAAAALPENATALQRLMANPVTARLFGGGIMGGMELGQEAIEGEPLDWRKGAIATGFGIIFNKPNRIGERIFERGAAPARRRLGLPARPAEAPPAEVPLPISGSAAAAEPRESGAEAAAKPQMTAAQASATLLRGGPTVAEVSDFNIVGPAVTEAVGNGAHERPAAALAAAREDRQAELAAFGVRSPVDVHAIAAATDPEAFAERDMLELGDAAISSVRDRLDDLGFRLRAAYRRAAEATGAGDVPIPETIAGGGEASEPDLKSAHFQAIADDVRVNLTEAAKRVPGVTAAHIEASSRIVAAFFDTLATGPLRPRRRRNPRTTHAHRIRRAATARARAARPAIVVSVLGSARRCTSERGPASYSRPQSTGARAWRVPTADARGRDGTRPSVGSRH
jgi:hypothetical protein